MGPTVRIWRKTMVWLSLASAAASGLAYEVYPAYWQSILCVFGATFTFTLAVTIYGFARLADKELREQLEQEMREARERRQAFGGFRRHGE